MDLRFLVVRFCLFLFFVFFKEPFSLTFNKKVNEESKGNGNKALKWRLPLLKKKHTAKDFTSLHCKDQIVSIQANRGKVRVK